MKHKFFKRCLPCCSPLSRVLRAGLVLGAVCCLVLALGSCGGQTETERVTHSDLPVVLVGSDNYPPFHYEDANGQPTGIDVDLAKEAFRRMGYQAVFVTIDWEDKKDLVERGEIDCIWGSFSSDGREDQYLWTEPYLAARWWPCGRTATYKRWLTWRGNGWPCRAPPSQKSFSLPTRTRASPAWRRSFPCKTGS